MAAAAASAILSELDDVTECPICTDVYTDPRVLPCVHTYCLKCIEDWTSMKAATGGHMECPLCRREFAVPSNGFSDLPKNYVVEKLIELRNLHHSDRPVNSDVESFDLVKEFCSECQQNLCQSCKSSSRNKSDPMNSHLEDETKSLPNLTVSPPRTADSGEELATYCFSCGAKVQRQTFNSCPPGVSDGPDAASCQMAGDVLCLAEGVEKLRAMLRNLLEHRSEVVDELRAVDVAGVNETATAEKCRRLNELENLTDEIEQRLSAMETFKANADKMRRVENMTGETECAANANDVETGTDEQLDCDVVHQPLDDTHFDDVKSTTHQSAAEAGSKELNICQSKWNSVLSTNIDKPLSAMAAVDKQIFLVAYGNNFVQVYDSMTLTLQYRVSVPSAGSQFYGLAACGHNNCLYVSDWDNSCVIKLDLDDNTDYVKWLVGNQPAGLSVTNTCNVLVTCHGSSTIQEYTTRGTPVQEIVLREEARLPWQAVQLTSGQLLVSHEGSIHGICAVGKGGQIEHTCRTTATCNYPRSIVIAKDNEIIVADQCNNRILVLNHELNSVHQLSVMVDSGLQGPFCLCIDKSGHRIFVGEWGGNRLLVLESVQKAHRR